MEYNTKTIRFSKDKINFLLRGGIIQRPEIVGNTDGEFIVLNNVTYGKAFRMNKVTNIEVMKNHGEWVKIKSGDVKSLQTWFTTDDEAVETDSSDEANIAFTTFDDELEK